MKTTLNLDDQLLADAKALPVFEGRGGLVAGVNPPGNKAMLEALGDDDA